MITTGNRTCTTGPTETQNHNFKTSVAGNLNDRATHITTNRETSSTTGNTTTDSQDDTDQEFEVASL